MKKAGMLGDNRGFTLIELVVVVVIVGILAAVTIPQYARHTENAKIKAAMAEITSIKTIIDLYISENGAPPTADNNTGTGVGVVLMNAGITWNGLTDPWDKNYLYETDNDDKYQISSAGPDTVWNGTDSDDIIATKSTPPKSGQYTQLETSTKLYSSSDEAD